MNKTTVSIKGMHCRSCELLIEEQLKDVPGIKKATVSQKQRCAQIYHNGPLNNNLVREAISEAGYRIGIEEEKPLFSRDPQDYIEILVAGIALFILFIIVDIFGLTRFLSTTTSHPSSLIAVLLIGVTAGFSTCMALIGGLILGVSARFAEKHPQSSALNRFKPHLFFNAGRITSYVIFGGVIGIVGSFFQLSGFNLGLLTASVALVMLTLGLQLSGLFPRLSTASFTLPKGISRMLGIQNHQNKEYSHKNAMIMGGLTFFLPCGFTQAMQLLAMSSGNFTKGAAIMGMFALGTAPGLLGIGGLTSALKGASAQLFFKFAGVVVTLLAIFNFNNGLNLMGLSPQLLLSTSTPAFATSGNEPTIEGNTQVVQMTQAANGYSPNVFTIYKDIPVKWVITSVDPNTCASSIVMSKFNIRQNLHPGENVFEFTPTDVGKIPFSCSMGMFTGVFNVIDKGKTQAAALPVEKNISPPTTVSNQAPVAACKTGGCGCGGGGAAAAQKPVVTAKPVQVGNTQVLKTTYTNAKDISPNEFSVKVNVPVRLEITVQDQGGGCMGTIMVSRLFENPQFLAKGTTITMEFTPKQKGDYPITCAMGVPRGVIKVI